ncbi:uncharacterized protein K452DRAFT_285624 [Aplosporella prunicola CBS 121167]|uniref:F-box domain-containing protein n=1 Tax=Aplosporella prunicola CBS 121167 TaxID=1176127 RepID=A0A6A6BIX6_9PEZI|nr:uncharacterized protein K452DRAFT_285624 [Aplosporella prunicola CBS 121167]KAF2143588.1 hypothetical protein K452DRAFT_285624 [Aplosporella prunicola CBS 121167]
MTCIFDLSNELLQHVLLHVEPTDLGRLSRTCQTFHTFIKGNHLLWKETYLRYFDNPPRGKDDPEVSWETELPRFVALDKLLSTKDSEVKKSNFSSIASAVCDLVATQANTNNNTQPNLNAAFLSNHFTNQANTDTLLHGSSLFTQAAGTPIQSSFSTPEQRQLSAKLHVLHGIPQHGSSAQPGQQPIDAYARSRVYDLRRYTAATTWGPFMGDGSLRVDWEAMESILIVLTSNMRRFSERTYGRFQPIWYAPFQGAAPHTFREISGAEYLVSSGGEDSGDEDGDEEDASSDSTSASASTPTAASTPMPPSSSTPLLPSPHHDPHQRIDSLTTLTPSLPLSQQDPYAVTGTYLRLVCFLDYTDLYAFNFERDDDLSTPITHNRRPSSSTINSTSTLHPREPLTTQEALRFIHLKLRPTAITPPGPTDSPRLPVVHFRGTSRAMHAPWDADARSAVRGSVRMTREGEVRWTTFSVFDGEERWRSETVQVGGVGSGRGSLGSWFDKDYDPYGPAGPTAFWKVSNELLHGGAGNGAVGVLPL